MKFIVRLASAFTLGLLLAASARASVEIEGVQLDDSTAVGGTKLVLNGATVRKRAYFKTDVVGLYLPQRTTKPDAIYKGDIPMRLVLVMLRDVPSATITRYFVSDFKQVASDTEFKQTINEVGNLGMIYGTIDRVRKGDIVTIDWTPEKGIKAAINGKLLNERDDFKSHLFWEIYMRMYVSAAAPEELRTGLLGLRAAK
ncbi:chalcone isomerase family protein [Aquabacterium sp.]|uniref:chalcone isomerase family protein n=1 Tax=Aquabacterium sp. TaxID=1872578 RepID=UPI0035B267EC